jgi:hypothetical protein
MEVRVTFTNSERAQEHDSIAEAFTALRERWPDLYAVGDGGWEADETTEDIGERILVWETEDESTDDDGARAVASIKAA